MYCARAELQVTTFTTSYSFDHRTFLAPQTHLLFLAHDQLESTPTVRRSDLLREFPPQTCKHALVQERALLFIYYSIQTVNIVLITVGQTLLLAIKIIHLLFKVFLVFKLLFWSRFVCIL